MCLLLLDNSNAACDATASKCQCKSAHFVSKKTGACKLVVPALDGAYEASDSASEQCAVDNSECRNVGTDKCLCKATHYVKEPLVQSNAEIAAGFKCLCKTNNFENKDVTCAARIKPNIACTAAGQCVTHATCDTTDTDKCVCDASYTPSPIIIPTMCKLKSKCKSYSHNKQVEEVNIHLRSKAVEARTSAPLLARII
ncbi:unnamed protein product [Mytilus edulis]|uniref:EB domain-containing protein n=1 Tax=Mytilus edulis TaxID=6550 RepID=A0A8S3QKR9_MYTED|nr:unnamed protein product [Mytilus edulis]